MLTDEEGRLRSSAADVIFWIAIETWGVGFSRLIRSGFNSEHPDFLSFKSGVYLYLHALYFSEELRLGHEKSLAYRDYVAVARGTRDQNIRAKEPEDGLTEETQVKCLIDQATDPNILGRVWAGWESWMWKEREGSKNQSNEAMASTPWPSYCCEGWKRYGKPDNLCFVFSWWLRIVVLYYTLPK